MLVMRGGLVAFKVNDWSGERHHRNQIRIPDVTYLAGNYNYYRAGVAKGTQLGMARVFVRRGGVAAKSPPYVVGRPKPSRNGAMRLNASDSEQHQQEYQ